MIKSLKSGPSFFLQGVRPDKLPKKKKKKKDFVISNLIFFTSYSNNKLPYKKITTYFYTNKVRGCIVQNTHMW